MKKLTNNEVKTLVDDSGLLNDQVKELSKMLAIDKQILKGHAMQSGSKVLNGTKYVLNFSDCNKTEIDPLDLFNQIVGEHISEIPEISDKIKTFCSLVSIKITDTKKILSQSDFESIAKTDLEEYSRCSFKKMK